MKKESAPNRTHLQHLVIMLGLSSGGGAAAGGAGAGAGAGAGGVLGGGSGGTGKMKHKLLPWVEK